MSSRLALIAASPLLVLAFASSAYADEPAVAPAAATPVAAPAPSAPLPTVELRADDEHATIERRLGTSTYSGVPFADVSVASIATWQQACVAPCQIQLDPHFTYRVAGDGLVPSSSFALPRSGDHVRVDAKMGSQTGRLLGIGLTGIGALGVAAGGLALGASPILESQDVGSKGFRTAVLAGGVTVLAAGIVTGITGLYLWLSNGSSATPRADVATASTPAARSAASAKPRLLPSGALAF